MLEDQELKAMEEAEESELVLVLTTEDSLEKAQQLATTLLEKALVACVSLQPIQSHYLWEGRITRSEEVQMVLKTHLASLEKLYQTVMDLHSYDTPEWITLRGQTRGAYGDWCVDQLNRGGEPLGQVMGHKLRERNVGTRAELGDHLPRTE